MGYGTPQQSIPASAGKAPLSKRAELFKQIKKHRYHYLFVLPMLVFFAAFTLWPMIASWYYSFFNWDGIGWPTDFIGLGNFREVASDPGFWNAFMNTFLFALTHVLIQMPLALIVAVILNNQFLAGRNVYRLLLGTGLINEPINFLGSTTLALPTLLAVSVWKSFGTPMIYWLAGLQTIPGELYEAAKIDGASKVQSFFRITVPMLAPIGLVITLLTFINNLDPFDLVRTMTEGGPVKATDVVVVVIIQALTGKAARRSGTKGA
jgi:multiple sugar transport system permease protein